MNFFMKSFASVKAYFSQHHGKFIMSNETQNVYDVLEKSMQNVFLTGKAGTGKSTVIQYFRSHTKKKVVVLSPTGLAALNVQGQTIHSFFRFPPRILTHQSIHTKIQVNLYRDIDCIVIDEISMVRADIIDGIDLFLRMHGRDKSLPFGGVQMIFVGDVYQLPPVLTTQDQDVFHQLYDSPYFFSARAFSQSDFLHCELLHIYRQKDPTFIEILNKIRVGDVSSYLLEPLNQRVNTHSLASREGYITLTTTNTVANSINASELNKINQKVYTFTAIVEGIFPTEERNLPVDITLQLKKGARVMFVKNDKGRRYVNGTIGVVHEIDETCIKVKIEDVIQEIVEVPLEQWENIKYEYDEEKREITPVVLGIMKQYPLKLAWAITIHKSQGMTFSKVCIDFSRSPFTHGQTYVALSRCRTLQGLLLTKRIWPNDVIVDERIQTFSKRSL